MKKIKNNKGITLLALIVYITIFILVIGVMTTISSFFYGNMKNVTIEPKYASEFNKFTMFFDTEFTVYGAFSENLQSKIFCAINKSFL